METGPATASPFSSTTTNLGPFLPTRPSIQAKGNSAVSTHQSRAISKIDGRMRTEDLGRLAGGMKYSSDAGTRWEENRAFGKKRLTLWSLGKLQVFELEAGEAGLLGKRVTFRHLEDG